MKGLVVLVLAVFTSCNANLLYADESRSKLDELITAFWDSAGRVITPTEDFLDRLQQTKFGQDLSARLEEGANVVKTNIQHVKKAWSHAPEEVKQFMGGLSFGIYGFAITVDNKKAMIKKNLEPFAERLAPVAEKIFSELSQKTQRVRDIASLYVNKLMEKVDFWSKDLPARLDTLYDSL